MAQLCQINLMGFFVQSEVAWLGNTFASSQVQFAFLAGEERNHFIHCQIGHSVVFSLSTDDERCTRFIDQYRVNLIDDGVIETALNPVMHFIHHVVAQIIEAVFVIGAVGDVALVSRLLFFFAQLGQVDSHTQA